jgi:hypothetical protein
MKILHNIGFALTGWIAGLLVTVGFSFLWLRVLPVVERTGQGAGFFSALGLILLLVSPAPLVGGLVGGRLPKEGGLKNQLAYAAIFGILFALPFACFLFWYTGW